LLPVKAGVVYEAPLTAEAAMSELPTPLEPITAVPPEKVATSVTGELKAGVAEFGCSSSANATECREELELEQPKEPKTHSANNVRADSSKMNLRFGMELFSCPSGPKLRAARASIRTPET
jgi:hypothetical protein